MRPNRHLAMLVSAVAVFSLLSLGITMIGASASSLSPTHSPAGYAIQPPPGPFSVPTPAPDGGYYVSCFGANLSLACQQALSYEPNASGNTIQNVMVQMTFLCQAPECNYVSFEPSASATPTATTPSGQGPGPQGAGADPQPEAVSGSGTTWGTSIDGTVPTSWNVPSSATVTVSAAVVNSQNTLRTGLLIGQHGSAFYSVPVPFFASSQGSIAGGTEIPPGDNVSFRVVNAEASGPGGGIYDYTLGEYVATYTFGYDEPATPRTNESISTILSCTSCTLNANAGYAVHGFFQPANTQNLDAWGSYTIVDSSPYSVSELNAQNYFAIPILA